ncbi:MAG: ATP-binding protein, partial [Bacillota bacterium]
FYVSYSLDPFSIQTGPYFYVHGIYSYICIITGLVYLCSFAIKNLGKLTPQAILITIGSFIPLVVNICYTVGVPGLTIYSTPTAFSITITLFVFAMTRFNLLKVTPIALQTIVNRISDSYIVIDPEMNIIDYNKPFKDNFSTITAIQRHNNLYNVIIDSPGLGINPDKLMDFIAQTVEKQCTRSVEHHFEFNTEEKYFSIEFTPIISGKHCIAIIILLKDITQHIKDFNTIQENQAILLERQRLASLGQLIGGIAHNLKTPIFSVSGGIDQLLYLVKEYDASIEDDEVTPKDHHEIAEEMHDWLTKMKSHMAYMSDIISAVKEQAAQFNIDTQGSFTVGSLLKRVDILMKHELIKNNCRLKKEIEVDYKTLIRGDINSLVQILDNIIINAIQAYEGQEGEIKIKITKQNEGTLIAISDRGKGISEKVKDMLFKEMITTKGKHGTGLGLYMSYSTIKGMFRGNMWFDSEFGKGTTFYVSLPAFDNGKE